MKLPLEFEGWSKGEIIRFLLEERVYLKSKLEELEQRLLAHENAHTPPSKSNERRYPKREPTGNPAGTPVGHKGVTRKTPEPTETKTLILYKSTKGL